ncbi:hypothetical protein [Legionella sp.]|uniref:hypothetical protein n=1 Tax=Legionella sp. TaxID=459 RepID=UPI00321F7322
MYFKDWCFLSYGISLFAEGKTVNSVFIPLVPFTFINSQFVADNRGYFLAHDNSLGVVFPKENYDNLMTRIRSEFRSAFPDEVNENQSENQFKNYKNNYFFELGLNDELEIKYKASANIYITLANKQARPAFMVRFAHYYPQIGFDPLTSNEVIAMPPTFLEELKKRYYQSTFSEISLATDLESLKAHEVRIGQLLQAVSENALILNGANKLFLDYDNDLPLYLTNESACSAYALSLSVFAEINHYTLSPVDYRRLQIASTRLAAYDDQQNLRQSLKSDIVFLHSLKEKFFSYVLKISDPIKGACPLITELPREYSKYLLTAIQNNTEDLLEGNSDAFLKPNAFFRAMRFFPDEQGQSDTDEIVLHGGPTRGHFSIFRIVKIGVLANGQFAGPDDKPHHFDYFKIENNLGSQSRGQNLKTKTCLGTYVTKLRPIVFSIGGEMVPLNIDPFVQPEFYQIVMKNTLRELIKTERLLSFYREPDPGFDNDDYSPVNSREAQEWTRLYRLRELLSGVPYTKPINYFIRDPIRPSIRYVYFACNQQGYIQEGGSCPIFSIKSFLDSVMGIDINSHHTNFGQQNNAQGYVCALQAALVRVQQRIREVEPLKIMGGKLDIYTWFRDFKKFLRVRGNVEGVSLEKSSEYDFCIKITDTSLKRKWHEFFAEYQKENVCPRNRTPYFFGERLAMAPVRVLKPAQPSVTNNTSSSGIRL